MILATSYGTGEMWDYQLKHNLEFVESQQLLCMKLREGRIGGSKPLRLLISLGAVSDSEFSLPKSLSCP